MTLPSASPESANSPGIDVPLRLLVVDDDDVDRERVSRLLAKIHLKSAVTEAASLEQAREAMSNGEFDCVFLDYQLGDHVGVELLHDISHGSLNYVPVVMVTGNSNERLVVEAMQGGAYDFIPKTQLHVDLLETVLVNSLLRANLERELKTKRERLEYLSFYDTLTGLPNRALFFDRLEQTLLSAKRNQRSFAVIQVDLNLFKKVNDCFGHAAGDTVLAVAAQRIKKALRATDSVARLGGDEFAAVLTDIDSVETTFSVAEKIVAAVAEPITDDRLLVTVGAAVGIALYPSQGDDAQTLLLKADRAMYAAKRAGTNHMLYAEGMEAVQQRPMLDISRIQQAIDRNELFMEFQPMVELASRKVNGAEALVRWRTASGEIISPGMFIPLAERSPIIRSLSYLVLNKVLDQMQAWLASGLHLPVSANLSARLLDDNELPARVFRGLAARGLPANLLTLELTETALMSNLEQAQKVLGELIGGGVRVSIDDFGAGFTSFKYLRQLEVSEIKIDMAFTSDMSSGSRDSVIVRSIATLASGFGIPAVAEGIENLANCQTLLELGCHSGQGYGIARPMAGEAIPEWIARWESAVIEPSTPKTVH